MSPARIDASGRVRPAPLPSDGTAIGGQPTAIASGALLRVEALRAIGPAPSVFWLDYLDHWMFRRLQQRGGALVPIDCELRHALSVASSDPPSVARYENVLRAERAFVGHPPVSDEFAYRARLLGRALRWLPRAPALARLAWRAACAPRP